MQANRPGELPQEAPPVCLLRKRRAGRFLGRGWVSASGLWPDEVRGIVLFPMGCCQEMGRTMANRQGKRDDDGHFFCGMRVNLEACLGVMKRWMVACGSESRFSGGEELLGGEKRQTAEAFASAVCWERSGYIISYIRIWGIRRVRPTRCRKGGSGRSRDGRRIRPNRRLRRW